MRSLQAEGAGDMKLSDGGISFNVGVDIQDVKGQQVAAENIQSLLRVFEGQSIFMNECRFGVTDDCADRMRTQDLEAHTRFTLVTNNQPALPALSKILHAVATATNDVLSASVEHGEGNVLRIKILVRRDVGDALDQIRTAINGTGVLEHVSQWEKEHLKPFKLAQDPSTVLKHVSVS